MMERLTERVEDYVRIKGCKTLYGKEERREAPACSAIARLAMYEDAGLTPEETAKAYEAEYFLANLAANLRNRLKMYEDAMPLERVQELAQAEKDGRMVVMQPNDPLTLEQLREMDGMPVWIKSIIGAYITDGWALVCKSWGMCKKSDGSAAFFDRCGKWWLAYRRKPEAQ